MVNLLKNFSSHFTLTAGFVGVAITDNKIFVVRFVKSNKVFQFDTYRELTLGEGVYEKDVLKNPAELVSVLKSIDKNLLTSKWFLVTPTDDPVLYQKICKQANLKPAQILTLSEASAKAVIPKSEKDVELLVSAWGHYLELTIVRSGLVLERKIIDFGLQEAKSVLAKSLGLSPTEVEEVFFEVGLSQKEETQAVLHNLVPIVSSWADEMNKLIFAWRETQMKMGFPEKMIERIILVGDLSRVPGLAIYFAGRTMLEVESGDPWRNLAKTAELIPTLSYQDSLRFTPAIGAVLESH